MKVSNSRGEWRNILARFRGPLKCNKSLPECAFLAYFLYDAWSNVLLTDCPQHLTYCGTHSSPTMHTVSFFFLIFTLIFFCNFWLKITIAFLHLKSCDTYVQSFLKQCLHDLQLTQFGGTLTKPFKLTSSEVPPNCANCAQHWILKMNELLLV